MNKTSTIQFIMIGTILTFVSIAMALALPFQSLYLFQVLNASEKQIGLFLSASSICNLVISSFLGYLSDQKIGRKAILYIGMGAGIISYFIYGVSKSFMTVFVVSCVLMSLSSCIVPQIFALSYEKFEKDQKNPEQVEAMIVKLRTLISAAWVMGPSLGGLIMTVSGFNTIFFIAGFLIFISLLISMIVYLNQKSTVSKKEQEAQSASENGKGILKKLLIFFLIFTSIQTVNACADNYFPLYLTERYGFTNQWIGVLSSYTSLLEIPFMLLWAKLISKISIRTLLNGGFVICGLFVIVYMCTSSKMGMVFCYCLKAIYYSILIGLGLPFFRKIVPVNKVGITTTLFLNTSGCGKIIAGTIIHFFGSNYNYLMIFLLVIVVIVIGAFYFTKDLEIAKYNEV